MNENTSITEDDKLDEAMPQGFWSRIWNGALSMLGPLAPNSSYAAKGKLEAGKKANELMNAYKQALGRTNQSPTLGTLMHFLQRYSYPTTAAKRSLGIMNENQSSILKYYRDILNEQSVASASSSLSDSQVATAIMAAVIEDQTNSEFGGNNSVNTSDISTSNSYASQQQDVSDVDHMRWLLSVLRRNDPSAFNAALSGVSESEEMVTEQGDDARIPATPISKKAIAKVNALQK